MKFIASFRYIKLKFHEHLNFHEHSFQFILLPVYSCLRVFYYVFCTDILTEPSLCCVSLSHFIIKFDLIWFDWTRYPSQSFSCRTHRRRRRGQRGTCPPSKIRKIFFGQLLCKIRAFSDKNHVKFGNFVNFREISWKFGYFDNFRARIV